MSDTKKEDTHHAPSPLLPAMKIIAIGLGFAGAAFFFNLGSGFLSEGASNLEKVFNVFVKLSIATAIAGLVYMIITDKEEHH